MPGQVPKKAIAENGEVHTTGKSKFS